MRSDEHQYLDLLDEILTTGDKRIDRTGVGTLSIFGAMMRADLSKGTVPLITTKKVAWKVAIRELLWFLKGETNIRSLVEQNVHIWTDWPLAAYRKATGENISRDDFERRIIEDEDFALAWGDLGPVYGKQWRRWKGPDGREYDQIAGLIHAIKETPASRRLLFHGWNVAEIDSMALPPCHLLYQFHVTSEGKLNSLCFQRSVDALLGQPFNIFSQAVLTRMIADQTGLQPGKLIWMGGDTHLYLNHLEQARTQIQRDPRSAPTLKIARIPDSIDDYRIEDFILEGYDPHPAIYGAVAV